MIDQRVFTPPTDAFAPSAIMHGGNIHEAEVGDLDGSPDRLHGPLAAIRRFASRRPTQEQETCELCAGGLAVEHSHLVELRTRRIVCCCDACAVLFSGQQRAGYRRVPDRIELLQDFRLGDAQWESLLIPINLAFFFHSTTAGRIVAVYPSPGGPIESLLGLES